MNEKWVPEIVTPLKQDIVQVPKVIAQASGIRIFGKKLSQLFLRQILQ